ncbi:hypothetical protein M422DRAFT_239950 [Sphaerobolus stellatus SS14]|nr:hypothetical protein M422DRAFT_239950 [Sphaerobolus stellatus SS14]
MQAASQRQPCLFYQNSSCKKGDRCPFIHSKSTLPSEIRKICKHFKTGTCRFGDECHDTHLQEEKSKSPKEPCKYWNASHCSRGSSCFYVHDPSVKDKIQTSGQILTTPNVQGSVNLGIRVCLSDRKAHISDSKREKKVTLSNLPLVVGGKEVTTKTEDAGNLKPLMFHPFASRAIARTAEAEYLDAESAEKAVRFLNGKEILGKRIVARLELKPSQIGTADLRSSILKLTWFAPSRIAYAHSSSISMARQKPGSRQTTSFSIVIKGLPSFCDIQQLKRLCGTDSFTAGKVTYTAKEGRSRLREYLEALGPLESFDCLLPKSKKTKMRALTRFVLAEDAAAAAKRLHGEGQSFLGSLRRHGLLSFIRRRTLTVHGDIARLQIIKEFIQSTVSTEESNIAEKGLEDCPVYFDVATDPVNVDCGHVHCARCLEQYMAAEETFPVRCFRSDGTCQVPISLQGIRRILGGAEESTFFERAFVTYIRQHPKDFSYCPTPDCQVVYRGPPGLSFGVFHAMPISVLIATSKITMD